MTLVNPLVHSMHSASAHTLPPSLPVCLCVFVPRGPHCSESLSPTPFDKSHSDERKKSNFITCHVVYSLPSLVQNISKQVSFFCFHFSPYHQTGNFTKASTSLEIFYPQNLAEYLRSRMSKLKFKNNLNSPV